MAYNVEKSREIRQWIKMIGSFVGTGVMFDYVLNDGKGVHKFMDKTLDWKRNFVDFKAKVRTKKEEVKEKIHKLTEKKETEE